MLLPRSVAQRQTIYALSTAPGKAGIAVFRLSGPAALDAYAALTRRPRIPPPRVLHRCRLLHPNTHVPLDDAMAVYFRSPRSFTTEDVVELHTHSGRALVSAILAALAVLPGCRHAEPGEFTRRAFLAGRLDLTQVEGLRDLIEAETETQRQWALGVADGALRQTYDGLRRGIIRCLAQVEALIDFGEGEDLDEAVYEQAREVATSLLSTVRTYLDDSRGEIIRAGIKLAIFGPPNAGKSSLLNFLAQREAAIVTPHPGTTRDILELSLDIAGLPVRVSDTAGLRKAEDAVEIIGVSKARVIVHEADVSLCVLSLKDAVAPTEEILPSSLLRVCLPEIVREAVTQDTAFLLNKSDLMNHGSYTGPIRVVLESENKVQSMDENNCARKAWVVSLKNGTGAEKFMQGLGGMLTSKYASSETQPLTNAPVITRARHREHLEQAESFLQAFLSYNLCDIVLAAEELRYAAQAISRVSGTIDVEDVLDAVFTDFCIGK